MQISEAGVLQTEDRAKVKLQMQQYTWYTQRQCGWNGECEEVIYGGTEEWVISYDITNILAFI